MSGYKKLTAAQIGDTFRKLSEKQKDFMDIHGIGNILRALGDSVKSMQDAGIDISIDVRTGQYADAYDMIFSNTEAKEAAVSTYGFLRIGPTVRLWAIAHDINGESAQKLAISEFNTAEGASRMSWSSSFKSGANVYDFAQDADALVKLQMYLIDIAADNHALAEYDSAQVFNRPAPASTQGKLPAKKLRPARP